MRQRPKTIFAIKSRSALTFIELFIVITIIGILAVSSLPNFRRAFDNLQLNNFCRQLQTFMTYLNQRSSVEGKLIYLNIDAQKREYWAQVEGSPYRLKTYPIPQDITIESAEKQIIFYPDGQIDKITITMINLDKQKISLTTKGVFGGAKVLSQE